MKDTSQCSIWTVSDVSGGIQSNKTLHHDDGEDKENKGPFQRSVGAFLKFCPCSTPLLLGLLIGGLITGIGLATVLSLYLVGSRTTKGLPTNTIFMVTDTSTTMTTVTSTTATSSTSSSSSTTSITTTSTTTTLPYCTTRVTFDDIPGQLSSSGTVPNGYNNLNWTNVQYINASSTPLSGYQYAVTSTPFVAHSPNALTLMITSANGTSFAFNSVVVSAAWRENLTWNLYGYRLGTPMFVGGLTLQVKNQTIVTCGGCYNLDTLYMLTSGGIPYPGLAQNGTQFAFDDLCISFGY